MPPKRAKTYHETFDFEEQRAVEGLRRARNRAQRDRYESDLAIVQSLRRRHERGEFPVRKVSEDY